MKYLNLELIFLICFLVAACSVAIYYDYKKDAEWQEFKVDNNCVVSSVHVGSINFKPTVATNGSVSIVSVEEPDLIAWSCSDGKVYLKR